jgi:OOP family OmpA-OmpF porin
MRHSLKATVIRITLPAALLAACLPLGNQLAAGPESRGDFVIDTTRGATRTGVTKDCIRTGVSDAGVSVAECLPTTSAGRPATEKAAAPAPVKAAPAREPAATDFVRQPEPPDMVPVPPMEPLASDDDRISDPTWYYDEEPRQATDPILGRTVNPNYEAEVAAAEAEMARSRQAPVRERPVPEPAAQEPAKPQTAELKPKLMDPTKKKIVRVTLEAGPNFDFNKAALRPTGKDKLNKFLAELQDIQYETITVVGHTDRIGSKLANQRLSQQRADSVKQYLMSNRIESGRITASGVGPTQPLTKPSDCKGLKGKKLIDCLQPDRRVEIVATGGQIVRQ